ncbi:MAG: hypothetical protein D6713_02900, partial [Deltaproteobacteria bacterium]
MERGFSFYLRGIFIAVAILLLFPYPGRTESYNIESKTYLLYFERDLPGETAKFLPLYEYLSGNVEGITADGLSFHFNGWGRFDLGDDSGEDERGGDLSSAYFRYLHPEGNGEVKAGRFLLTEGIAASRVDGIFLKGRTPLGVGVSLYGGLPVEGAISGAETGDFLGGGRIFYEVNGLLEAGVSYLWEDGNFRDGDRSDLGVDIWLRPYTLLEFSGQAGYSFATSSLAFQDYLIRLFPAQGIQVGLTYEQYKYKGFFQPALNPAFASPALDLDDQVQVAGVFATGTFSESLSLTASLEVVSHESGKEGDANRYSLSGEYRFEEGESFVGGSVAFVDADEGENEYSEVRGYGTLTYRGVRMTFDGLYQRLKEAIYGEKKSYQLTGGANYEIRENLAVRGE